MADDADNNVRELVLADLAENARRFAPPKRVLHGEPKAMSLHLGRKRSGQGQDWVLIIKHGRTGSLVDTVHLSTPVDAPATQALADAKAAFPEVDFTRVETEINDPFTGFPRG